MKPVKQSKRPEDRVMREEDDTTIKFLVLQELADKAVTEGRWEDAYALYEQVLKATKSMNDSKLECEALIDLGSVAINLGQTDLALKHFKNALKIAKKADDFRVQSTVYGKIAIAMIKMHRPDLAAQYFERATKAANTAKSHAAMMRIKRTEIIPQNALEDFKQHSAHQAAIELDTVIEQEHRTGISPKRLFSLARFMLFIGLVAIIFSAFPISAAKLIILSPLVVGVLFVGLILIVVERTYFSSPHEQ